MPSHSPPRWRRRAGKPLDWEAIDRSLAHMTAQSDAIVVEGVGGLMVPMDPRHTFRDVARAVRAFPAVVVVRPGLGTINHTLLTVNALRQAGVRVAGVVINRYPTDNVPITEEPTPPQSSVGEKSPSYLPGPRRNDRRPRVRPASSPPSTPSNWLGLAQSRD